MQLRLYTLSKSMSIFLKDQHAYLFEWPFEPKFDFKACLIKENEFTFALCLSSAKFFT